MNTENTITTKDTIHRDGSAPREMLKALEMLQEIDENTMIGNLCNDTANAYRATVKAIAELRESLDEIEQMANERLQSELAHHRQYVAEIEAVA